MKRATEKNETRRILMTVDFVNQLELNVLSRDLQENTHCKKW